MRLCLALSLAYPGSSPDYWQRQCELDDRFIATAVDLLPD